ncbi:MULTISPECIES: hypothetical protein [unclassified Vibrio]|uniref:hypothetical protein n=1 Tax=unclassified Vibrio TaxID=2614977 RepID=UPI001055505E|nr:MULTISPECIES: hypothetical protein [unclassified Vibrio]
MNKIHFMDHHFSSSWEALGMLFLGPILTSLAYLFVYPIPAEFVFSYTQKRQKNLKTIKIDIEEDTPLSEAESRALRAKIPELEYVYNTQLTKKDSEIEKLKSQLKQQQSNEDPEDAIAIDKQQPIININHTSGDYNNHSTNTDIGTNENYNDDERPTNIIKAFTVNDQVYSLGTNYDNSEPGSINVVQLNETFSLRDKIRVNITLDTELKSGQYITVFDGYSVSKLDGNSFEFLKDDYEEKNAFMVVQQLNPLRPDSEMVVSNRVQFAY